jgi:hypothetical protein
MKRLKGRKLATMTSEPIEWIGAVDKYEDEDDLRKAPAATAAEDAPPAADLDEEERNGLPAFSMVAYTGGAMSVRGWDAPVVVDLAGLQWTAKPRPILRDHSPGMPVGHTTAIRVADGRLIVDGFISGAGAVARELVESSRNGFPWQASIGADAGGLEFIDEDEEAVANGRTFAGPVYVSRRAVLGEISFVALGADDDTEARVAASAAGDDEMNKTTAPSGEVAASAAAVVEQGVDPVAAIRASAAAEALRIEAIEKVAGSSAGIRAKAIAEGWDATRAELEVLRAERAQPVPAGIVRNAATGDAKVIEAAIAKAGNLPNIEKAYKPETLEAADEAFKVVSLQEVLVQAANRNGWHGSVRGDMRGMLQAAFSTNSIAGVLSNLANKFLLAGYTAVDQAWRAVSSVRNVSDFKTANIYRLTASAEFAKVENGGEITHGTLGEQVFTNKADTYARMLAITRQDIINDDLGAITTVPQQLGRGAGLALNRVFWTTFLAEHTSGKTLFPTNKSKGNFIDGATASAVSVAGLTTAEQAFLNQTDPGGFPLGIMPQVWLVPTKFYATAVGIMASLEVRETGSTDKAYTVANPHAGKFQVVTSPYLSNSAMGGAHSVDFWYLLANPAELSFIEVAFLNGIQVPTVEEAEADFNTLGIQMRGYMDFGVSTMEHRAAVKSKNAA